MSFDEITLQFKEDLIKKGSAGITVRGYVSDVNHFLRWFASYAKEKELIFYDESSLLANHLSKEVIEEYKQSLLSSPNGSDNKNTLVGATFVSPADGRGLQPKAGPPLAEKPVKTIPLSTLNHRLSSLRKFCRFLVSQGLLKENFAEKVTNTPIRHAELVSASPELERSRNKFGMTIIKEFRAYLWEQNASKITIKNYLSDISQFTSWISGTTRQVFDLKFLTPFYITEYKNRLFHIMAQSPRSINRKLSSLRQFCRFAKERKGLAFDPFVSDPGSEAYLRSRIVKEKPYSFVPPVRVTQKTARAFDYLLLTPFTNALKTLFSPFLRRQPPLANIPKEFYAPLSLENLPFSQKVYYHLKYTRPKWYKKYHQLPLSNYLNLAILILFCAAVGFGLYQQLLGPQVKQQIAALPTVPPRYLSFQGRLTDQYDNPIVTSTAFTFSIYDALENGNQLWSETKNITPDSDGIFSTLLGDTNPIQDKVFRDYSAIWLEVTVGGETLTPRQRIATVAYALNAEYLQGYPASTSANINTIPVVDGNGALTLAASSPMLQSTSGNFTVKGQVLTIQSSMGTGGLNISAANTLEIKSASGAATLRIDQLGTGDLFSASASGATKATLTNTGSLTLAGDLTVQGTTGLSLTGNEADLTFSGTGTHTISASSGTLSLGAYTLAGNITGSSSPTITGLGQLTVDNLRLDGNTLDSTTGNLTLLSAGELYFDDSRTSAIAFSDVSNASLTSGNSIIGGINAAYNAAAGSGVWTIANQGVHPSNTSLNLYLGGTATSSAKFMVLGTTVGTLEAGTASTSGQLTLNRSGTNYINALGGQALSFRTSPGGDAGVTERLFIAGSGNVGIGTTEPAGKLHVVGECVAEDSIVPVLKRSDLLTKASIASHLPSESEAGRTSTNLDKVEPAPTDVGVNIRQMADSVNGFDLESRKEGSTLEYKQIKDVSAGDYVLSLNENTGTFEWQKVEKTLDKGEQEVYELITESGKRIETTENHPYLVRGQNDLLLEESDISQQKNNHGDTKGNRRSNVNVNNEVFEFSFGHTNFLNVNAVSKETIANTKSTVKTKKLARLDGLTVGETINITPNQPADKLINKSETTVSKIGSNFINNNLTNKNIGVNEGTWTKVIYLKEDQEIATLNTTNTIRDRNSFDDPGSKIAWEKIVSIKKTGIRHVYDLQIENTANFVAGHYLDKKTGRVLNEEEEKALFAYLSSGGSFAGEFGQENKEKQNSNQGQTNTDINSGSEISQIDHSSDNSSSIDITLSWAEEILTENGIDLSLEKFVELVKKYQEGEISFGGLVAHNTYIMSGNLGIGTTSPLATLDVRGNLGTSPAASISGQSSFAALIVDNKGVGDLFTASSSGMTRFTIGQNGLLTLTGGATIGNNTTNSLTFTTPYATFSGQKLAIPDTLTFNRQGQSIDNLTLNTLVFTSPYATFSGQKVSANGNLVVTGTITANTTGTINSVNISSGTISNATWQGNLIGLTYGGTNKNLTVQNGGVVWTDTDSMEVIAAGSAGQVLQSGGAGTPVWADAGSLGSGWTFANQGVYPTNTSLNLYIGGTATSSAKFMVLGTTVGTLEAGTASTSGQITLNRNGTNYINSLGGQALSLRTSPGGDTGLTDRLTLLGNGNVGIGTTSPSDALHVQGGSDAGIRISASGTERFYKLYNGSSLGDFRIKDTLANADRFTIGNTGNVGIGTINPSATLDLVGNLEVNGYATASSSLALGTANAAAGPGNLNMSGILTVNNICLSADCKTVWPTGGGSNWALGNQGIYPNNYTQNLYIGGTATASAKFMVLGTTVGSLEAGTASTSGQLTLNRSGTNYINSLGGQALSLRTSPGGDAGLTDRLTILGNGNVGIGTTSPAYKLSIVGTASISGQLNMASHIIPYATSQFDLGSATNKWQNVYANNLIGTITPSGFAQGPVVFGGTGGSLAQDNDLWWDNSSKRLGIGTTAPGANLQVGTNRPFTVDGASGTTYLKGDAGGWAIFHHFKGSSGTDRGGFGAYGAADALTYLYAGDSYSSPTMVWKSGNVGIGTTSPGAKLHIAGADGSTESVLIVSDGNATPRKLKLTSPKSGTNSFIQTVDTTASLILGANSATDQLVLANGGYVGIGTTAPASKLDVQGLTTIGTTSTAYSLNMGPGANIAFYGPNGYGSYYVTGGTEANGRIMKIGSGMSGADIQFDTYDGNFNFITSSTGGNVGIGTTSPVHKLSVVGTASISGQLNMASHIIPYTTGQFDLGSSAIHWANLYADNIYGGSAGIQGFWQRTSGSLAPTNITDALNLGATATTSALVHFTGTSGGNSWINTGNVGIGTTAPGAKLEVVGNIYSYTGGGSFESRFGRNSGEYLTIEGDDADYSIISRNDADENSNHNLALKNFAAGTGNQSVSLWVQNNSVQTQAVRIDGGGNVGIGTTSPGAKLDINDNSVTTGTAADISSTSITSGKLLNLTQTTSTFTGDGLYMNLAAGSGTFTGDFLDLRNNATQVFGVNYRGGITASYTTAAAGEAINLHNLTYVNTRQDATSYNALNVSGNQTTIASATTGGTDQTLDNTYEGFLFNSGSYNSIGGVILRLKKSATTGAAPGAYVYARLYTDNAGVPGTLLASGSTIYLQRLTTSYANYSFSLSANLTASTNYWVLLQKVSFAAQDNVYSDTTTTGTNEWAYGDGTTWTLDATTKGYYYVYTRSTRGLYASTYAGEAVYGVSTNGMGVRGQSTQYYGVYGNSTYNYGGYFDSGAGIYNNVSNSSANAIYQATTLQRAGNRYYDLQYNNWFSGDEFNIQAGNPVYTNYYYYYDGAAFTNWTADLRYPGGSAITLLADTDDVFYFGRNSSSTSYRNFWFDIATAGNLAGLTWEYSSSRDGVTGDCNGWTAFTPNVDETNNLTQDGKVELSTAAVTQCKVNTVDVWWFRIQAATSVTTAPTAYAANFGMFTGYFARFYGTAAEKFRMDYLGNIVTTGYIYPGAGGEQTALQTTRGIYDTGSAIGFNTNVDITAATSTLSFSSSTGVKQITTGGTTNLALMPGGNVGIGTTGPSTTLEVNGDIALSAAASNPMFRAHPTYYTGIVQYVLDSDNNYKRALFGSNVYWKPSTSTWEVSNMAANDFAAMIHENNNGLAFYTATSTASAAFNMSTTEFNTYKRMVITAAGNVGIGTTPTGKLQVVGDEVRIGDSGTVNYAADDGDLYVEDALEVDGTAYFGSISSSGNLDMQNNLILNIGAAGTDFTTGGGLTLAGDLTITGNDLTFGGGATIDNNTANALTFTEEYATFSGQKVTANEVWAAVFKDTSASSYFLDPAASGNGLVIAGHAVIGGNTTLGDASGDTVTSNAAAWTFVNDTNFALSGGVNGLSFDTDTLSIDATSNYVGIGTTGPATKLDVNYAGAINTTTPGTALYNLHLSPSVLTADYAMGITFGSTNGASTPQAGIYVQSSGSYGTKMYFGTTSSYAVGSQTRMTIDHLGNVGIGTAGPLSKLHVAGKTIIDPNDGATSNYSEGLRIYNDSNSYSILALGASGATGTQTGQWTFVKMGDGTNNLQFRYGSGGTVVQTLTSGGNVGIGTTSPGAKLEIAGTSLISNTTGNITIDSVGGNISFNGDNLTSVTQINTGGYVFVGQYLNVGLFTGDSPGSTMCKRSYDNYVGLCSSLREYKKNIADLDLGLETLLKLQPKTFDWKQPAGSGSTYHDLGFIAEDVEAINPLLASYDKGKLIGVKYEKLTALLVNAIKEQQSQISSLSATLRQEASEWQAQLNNLFLDSAGEIQISNPEGTYDGLLANQPLEAQSEKLKAQNYSVKLKTGEIITRLANFAEIATAKIKAGLVETTNLIAENLISENAVLANFSSRLGQISSLTSEVINSASANIESLIVGQKLLAPIAEVDLIKTREIQVAAKLSSPLAELPEISTRLIKPISEGDLVIRLLSNGSGSTNLSHLRIEDEYGKALALIDAAGNASFSGNLSNLGNLSTLGDATIGGTLRAKKIFADEIEGLSTSSRQASISANYITNISNNIYQMATFSASSQSQSPEFSATNQSPEFSALNSGDWSGRDWSGNVLTLGPYVDIATLSANMAYVRESLGVLGMTLLSQTSVMGTFSQDASLIIDEGNRIEVLSGDLYLQKLRMGGVNIANGRLTIDRDGNLVTKGDVTVKGVLSAKIISPLPEEDLILRLSATESNSTNGSNLRVENASGSAVLAISDQGDLLASGSAQAKEFKIIREAQADTSPEEIVAYSSAGNGKISALHSNVLIKTPYAQEKSLIYITPTGGTEGKTLYLESIRPKEGFRVGVDNLSQKDLLFNWLIIN